MGKSNSKLKKKNRTQSMTWNFRFPSLTSLSVRKRNSNGNPPHMRIAQWLSILNLQQYEDLFRKFKGIEDLIKYTEDDLKDLGVKNDAHRTQMLSSLIALQTKYERSKKSSVSKNSDKTFRHSLAVDPATLVNQNATEADILVIKNINQSKSLSNIKMEAVSPGCNSDTSQLKKILEWELSLDARDLRSHAWYHGTIPRIRAEEIVSEQDGDFLVRDCTSQPGNYVLSCRSKGQNLHFVISKVVLQPDTVYERVQYRFEEDSFDTVPDLITYYVGSGKTISSASGAHIHHPRNRLYPLSFYATKYECSTPSLHGSPPRSRRPMMRTTNKQRSLSLLPGNSLPRQKSEKNGFANSLPRHGLKMQLSVDQADLNRGEQNSPSTERPDISKNGEPPPKPNRVSKSIDLGTFDLSKEVLRKNSFYMSGSDSGNGSGDSVHSSSADGDATPLAMRGVVIRNPKYYALSAASSVTTLKAFREPIPELPSFIDLHNFQTLLLPSGENKPLDTTALQDIHVMLQESGSRILANHLTRADLELTIGEVNEEQCYGCTNGVELCMVLHGRRRRSDLIERTECVKLLVAVTILTCSTESERAEILNKWIQVAVDTKTALGNLFGFCSIMLGLCMPQVQRLNETWHTLRQRYTDSAFNFEAKLRPTLKCMNDCTNPLAPNTTIPHLIPSVLLYDRVSEVDSNSEYIPQTGLTRSCIEPWELSSDLGLSALCAHMSATRQFVKSVATFRRNSEIVLADAKSDELLSDMFRTEFLLKFLWGSRGSLVGATERYSKFDRVLDVMSEKCESYVCSPEPETPLLSYSSAV